GCRMNRPIYSSGTNKIIYGHCANKCGGNLMANIAETVKELERERDRLSQAIAALAPTNGNEQEFSKTRRSYCATLDFLQSCAKEAFARAKGAVVKTSLRGP